MKHEIAGPCRLMISADLLQMPAAQQPTDAGDAIAVPTHMSVGTVFTFRRQFDEIKEHTHVNGGTNHLVIVLSGTIAFQTKDDKVDLPAGAIHLAELLVPHRLVAISEPVDGKPAAVCLNIPVAKFDVGKTQQDVAAIGKQLEALQVSLGAAAAHVKSVRPGFWR